MWKIILLLRSIFSLESWIADDPHDRPDALRKIKEITDSNSPSPQPEKDHDLEHRQAVADSHPHPHP